MTCASRPFSWKMVRNGPFLEFIDDGGRNAAGEIDAAMRLHHHRGIAGQARQPDDELVERAARRLVGVFAAALITASGVCCDGTFVREFANRVIHAQDAGAGDRVFRFEQHARQGHGFAEVEFLAA